MLHNKNLNVEYTNNNTKFTDYNYLVVDVNGFNNINTGTNDVLTSASAVMVSLTPIPTVMSMRTLEFKNVNSSLITYPINPISSLNKFDVKIKNNLGFSPNSNSRDVLNINRLEYTNNQGINNTTEHIEIITNEHFSSEFSSGDIIIIKNYSFQDTNNNNNQVSNSNIAAFENFINRDEGHKIIDISFAVGDGQNNTNQIFNNVIQIARPYELVKPENGKIKTKTFFENFNTMVEDLSEINCVLINVNLQSTIFININTLEKENTIMLINLI